MNKKEKSDPRVTLRSFFGRACFCAPRNGKKSYERTACAASAEMKKSIKDTVREAIEPTVTELGYGIWDITYSKIGADYHLEITIDKEGGINIEDCERVHRAIDPIIDECDPIEGFYYLDVSSPGVERELRTDAHIEASIGERVLAKLFAAKDGMKSVEGELAAFDGTSITIKMGESDITLAKSDISKLTTVFF